MIIGSTSPYHFGVEDFEEGVSTRLLVYAAKLIKQGIAPKVACDVAFSQTLTDDPALRMTIQQLILDFFR